MQSEFSLTKIIATLGPATANLEIIRQLIKEGVSGFRLNFSHGSAEEHLHMLNLVRKAGNDLDAPVAVLGDLPGPKIRIGEVQEEGIYLKKDAVVEFHQHLDGPAVAAENEPIKLCTNYDHFLDEVKAGHRVLIDDGNVSMICTGLLDNGKHKAMQCRVTEGGKVTSRKGVNLPDTELSVPALTEKDIGYIEFAVKNNIDFLALSFVRKAGDVRELKEHLRRLGARPALQTVSGKKRSGSTVFQLKNYIPVVCKIEKPQAIDNLEEIVKEADCIMVARGDLGVEMDLAEVAVLQKRVIHLCRDHGVPVIVATQMLQSMIDVPNPTRAEVSDVANAIFDGADSIMLSGETAVGNYPVEAVKMMSRIVEKTNAFILTQPPQHKPPQKIPDQHHRTVALAHGVQTIVKDLNARKIILWTQMGGGAVYLSQFKIPRPIIAFSDNMETLRRMALVYAMVPVMMKQPESGSAFIKKVDKYLLKNRMAEKGETVVFVLSEPINRPGVTNRLVIHYVGDAE